MFANRDKQNVAVWFTLKNNPIAAVNGNSPEPLKLALERVEAQRRVQGLSLKIFSFLAAKTTNSLGSFLSSATNLEE